MTRSTFGRPLEIAIVGAGLLGRLLAWRLLRQGHRVSLFEAGSFDQPRSAAHTAAAMISPLSEVVSSEPLVYHLGMASLALWPQWLSELNSDLPSPVQYGNSGSIVVAHAQDAAELQQFKYDLQTRLQHDDNSRWLDQRELADYEPDLAHFPQALYLPGEAHVDNRHLLGCLLNQIGKLGGHCVDNTPVIFTNGELDLLGNFNYVVDCRGMGSKENHPGLRGVRGEVMWVETGEVRLQHAVRLMHPRYKLYVVPKPQQRFIIGATEIESEDRSPISLQSTLELASALYTINPALAEARVIETDTNLRPAYADNLPRITVNGSCISINGLYRHGYLLAPVMVDHLAQFLDQGSRGHFWNNLVHHHSEADRASVAPISR
ncbi:glycine oxidase ThiO [Proteobacteria bacterium 005FR1]|nr:glycine oxidase ThiO [Proteobacteria bacterium 005FR1]